MTQESIDLMSLEDTVNPMTLGEYQKRVRTTAVYPTKAASEYLALGLNGEAGEVANELKKVIRDDAEELTSERRGKIISELGDCLWYIAELSTLLGVRLDTVAARNLSKVERRTATGKYVPDEAS